MNFNIWIILNTNGSTYYRIFRSKNIFSKLWNPLKNSFFVQYHSINFCLYWFPLSLTLEMSLTWTQFHSNGQNVLAIGDSRSGYHVHQISGVKWQSGTWKKEIPLLINFVSLIIVHYLRVPVVQEGRKNTIFFMYMIETCAFFWNFRENVNVLKNSLLKMSNSIFFDWKESTSFYHTHENYSVSSTFLYNGNSKCCVVRILYAISFQCSKCFGYRGQQIILKLNLLWLKTDINIKTYTVIFGMQISHL
jgi:hypothetical protein